MPTKRAKPQSGDANHAGGGELRLIANLLGLLATKDMGEGDKIGTLNAVGFSNLEVARLLGKDANTVNVTLSQRRKRKNKK